jgi:hypothetical protein
VSERLGPGSLKIIVTSSPTRTLRDAIDAALRAHVRGEDIHAIADGALLVHAEAGAGALRDLLAPLLGEGEAVFVAEFERWSSHGLAIDRRWLAARGH